MHSYPALVWLRCLLEDTDAHVREFFHFQYAITPGVPPLAVPWITGEYMSEVDWLEMWQEESDESDSESEDVEDE